MAYPWQASPSSGRQANRLRRAPESDGTNHPADRAAYDVRWYRPLDRYTVTTPTYRPRALYTKEEPLSPILEWRDITDTIPHKRSTPQRTTALAPGHQAPCTYRGGIPGRQRELSAAPRVPSSAGMLHDLKCQYEPGSMRRFDIHAHRKPCIALVRPPRAFVPQPTDQPSDISALGRRDAATTMTPVLGSPTPTRVGAGSPMGPSTARAAMGRPGVSGMGAVRLCHGHKLHGAGHRALAATLPASDDRPLLHSPLRVHGPTNDPHTVSERETGRAAPSLQGLIGSVWCCPTSGVWEPSADTTSRAAVRALHAKNR